MRHSLVSLLWLSAACAAGPADKPAETPDSADPSGQSYPAALKLVCDVDRLSGATPDDPLELEKRREEYLLEHVKNPDGIYFLTVFRTKDSAGKAAFLVAETRAQNISECPLLTAL